MPLPQSPCSQGGGCHFLGCSALGWGYSVKKISTRIRQIKVHCETKTADDVFVTVQVSVQMEVMKEHAYDAIYKLTNAHEQIDSYVANVIRGELPKMKLDAIFTQKEEVSTTHRVRRALKSIICSPLWLRAVGQGM